MVFFPAKIKFVENGTWNGIVNNECYNFGDNTKKVIIGTQVSRGGWKFPGKGYWVSDRAYACDMRNHWGGWWVAYFYGSGNVDVTFVEDNPNNSMGTYDINYIPTADQIRYKAFNKLLYGPHRLSFKKSCVSDAIDYSLPYSQPWTHNTKWSGNLQSRKKKAICDKVPEKSMDIELCCGNVNRSVKISPNLTGDNETITMNGVTIHIPSSIKVIIK